MDNPNRVAIITGASQGIGAGLVVGFRKIGYRVVANSRGMRPTDDPDIITVPGDIGDEATATKIVDEAVRRFGRIDTLVNNAGIFVSKPFTAYTLEDFRRVVATNLAGFFSISQSAMRIMADQRFGHIVNITTSLVRHASSAVPAALAALTKGGLDAVTRSLAVEYAKSGVRINAVSPGVIRTPMHPPEVHEALGALHPMKRMGDISDIVGAVLYLESASFVTGETLHVDGGQAAGL